MDGSAAEISLPMKEINCKEIAFASAAPETVRTGTGVGE